jgi:tRNA(Met) C34 N-acetyltransferase TmcA
VTATHTAVVGKAIGAKALAEERQRTVARETDFIVAVFGITHR